MTEQLAVVYYNRGLALLRDGMVSDGIVCLKKAVGYDYNNSCSWNLLGLAYYQLGNYKSSEYCWAESLILNPEQISIKQNLERLQFMLGDYITDMNNIQEYISEEKFKKAEKLFEERIIERCGVTVNNLVYQGLLKHLSGKKKNAVKLWRQALDMDRSNQQASDYIIKATGKPGFFVRLLSLFRKTGY